MIPSRNRTATIFVILVVVSGGTLLYLRDAESEVLLLSTTTSVENTGLLDVLTDEFEKETSIKVRVSARGSGQAIQLARDGEVDAVLVHAPDLEEEFVSDEFGINRTTLWFNFFMIAGPEHDPAGVKLAQNVTEAFSKIFTAGENDLIQFYSRGDQSGTHLKELEIWESISLDVSAQDSTWYFESGSGMADTIRIGDENNAYVLSDLGTFIQLKASESADIDIISLYTGDPLLFNPYSYIISNPDKYSNLNTEAAFRFLEFLQLDSTKDLVNNFKVANTVLFTPIGN